MSNPVFRFATVQGQNTHWFLKRNCSVTPAQLAWLYLSLCVVLLGIGCFFWLQGALLILPFASLELALVGVAFLLYARHAADGERISLQGGRLVVESAAQVDSVRQRTRADVVVSSLRAILPYL